MPEVKTTLWPDRTISVDEAEERDLRAQGLLLEDEDDEGKPSRKKKED